MWHPRIMRTNCVCFKYQTRHCKGQCKLCWTCLLSLEGLVSLSLLIACGSIATQGPNQVETPIFCSNNKSAPCLWGKFLGSALKVHLILQNGGEARLGTARLTHQ